MTNFQEMIFRKSNLLTLFQTEEDMIIATYINEPYLEEPL
jgi:hypothetical protein